MRATFLFRSFLWLACAPLALQSLASGAAQVTDATFHASADPGLETAILPTLYPSSHAANLLVLRNGDVLCFWFSGTWEGESGVGIVVSRLPKGSQTWQTPILIDREDGKSFQNPVPFEDSHGRIWLFHTSQSAGKGQADAQVLKVWSDDGGHTWSDYRTTSAGKIGQTALLCKFNRLGSTRRNSGLDRIFELSSTDQFRVGLTGADLTDG